METLFKSELKSEAKAGYNSNKKPTTKLNFQIRAISVSNENNLSPKEMMN